MKNDRSQNLLKIQWKMSKKKTFFLDGDKNKPSSDDG